MPVTIPAITTMAMISHSHHRLLPLSLSVGAAALLDVTTLDAAAELLAAEELLVAELDALEDGVGVGDGGRSRRW